MRYNVHHFTPQKIADLFGEIDLIHNLMYLVETLADKQRAKMEANRPIA